MDVFVCPTSSLVLARVVVHEGQTLARGHFYAYVKSSTGNWAKMDDADVSKVGIAGRANVPRN